MSIVAILSFIQLEITTDLVTKLPDVALTALHALELVQSSEQGMVADLTRFSKLRRLEVSFLKADSTYLVYPPM